MSTDPRKKRVMVGLSGGVDSAVAAALLLDQGYEIEALFMKNWDDDDKADYCPAEQDLADARGVCEQLGIKLRTISFSSEYWDRVFAHFLAQYRAGRTPNPDILCNREIKFRAFLDYALGQGAGWIATGHYARVAGRRGARKLLAGIDANKDQSYFLHQLNQRALDHTLFPLGELEKPAVRALARERGFGNAGKKDSTGICFIGERKFSQFLARYLPARPGDIVDPDGCVLGQHQGLMFHTIGQRQGLGIGGMKDADDAPWYVADKLVAENRLLVVQGKQHPALFRQVLNAADLHWISGAAPADQTRCLARIRYRQPLQECTLHRNDDDSLSVHFDIPQRAVTPGQAVVFYTDDICLGGGTIES